jgi:hypothetical protein
LVNENLLRGNIMSMNFIVDVPSRSLDGNCLMKDVGVHITRMGFVVNDAPFQTATNINDVRVQCDIAKYLRVSGAGDIVFQFRDGNIGFISSVLVGEWLFLVCVRVLSSYDFGGSVGVKTTTATGITWYGGLA